MIPLTLSEAVKVIDIDASRYGEVLLTHVAGENASAVLIGPAGGETTRVAYKIADDDPWFECVPPPASARERWVKQLLAGRGLSLVDGEKLDGKFAQRREFGPSLFWHAQADSPDRTILLVRS
jgi:hypothetical protein